MTITNPNTGKKLLLLGVDEENVKRLTAGKPILVQGEPMGLGFDVSIVYGKQLQDIIDELQSRGFKFPEAPPPSAQQ